MKAIARQSGGTVRIPGLLYFAADLLKSARPTEGGDRTAPPKGLLLLESLWGYEARNRSKMGTRHLSDRSAILAGGGREHEYGEER